MTTIVSSSSAASSKILPAQISPDDFDIGDECGRGACSVVYRARHRGSGQLVALKQLPRHRFLSDCARGALRREINFHRSLRHANIVRLLSYFTTDDAIVLVLEQCDATLRTHLEQRGGRLDTAEASLILAQIGEGLRYVHEQGFVHRDLKLENVLLRGGVAKLADFGCVRAALEGRSTVCGTLDYLAPEMIDEAPHSVEGDVWALGVLACEMLGGDPPFYRPTRRDTLHAIRCEAPLLPDGLPCGVTAIVERMLAKNPRHRPSLDEVMRSELCTFGSRH
jgi:aurora kinase